MLAQLHIHSLFKRLRHRQRYPHLPCPRVPRGSPPRDAHVLPADGMHVAVRQLEQWPFRGKDYRMECPGLCSCVCRRLWNVSYSCWDVWDCCWGYQGFQGDERGGGLVVCRQLQLCIRYVYYRQRSYITRFVEERIGHDCFSCPWSLDIKGGLDSEDGTLPTQTCLLTQERRQNMIIISNP